MFTLEGNRTAGPAITRSSAVEGNRAADPAIFSVGGIKDLRNQALQCQIARLAEAVSNPSNIAAESSSARAARRKLAGSARIARPGSPKPRTSGQPDRGQQKRPGRNRTDLSFVYLSLPVHPWSKQVDEASRAALFPALISYADVRYVVAQSVDIKAVSHLPVR